jgi:hypothetical protein
LSLEQRLERSYSSLKQLPAFDFAKCQFGPGPVCSKYSSKVLERELNTALRKGAAPQLKCIIFTKRSHEYSLLLMSSRQ